MSKASDAGQRLCHTTGVGSGRRSGEVSVQALTLTAALKELAVQLSDLSGEPFPFGFAAGDQPVSVLCLVSQLYGVRLPLRKLLEPGRLVLRRGRGAGAFPAAGVKGNDGSRNLGVGGVGVGLVFRVELRGLVPELSGLGTVLLSCGAESIGHGLRLDRPVLGGLSFDSTGLRSAVVAEHAIRLAAGPASQALNRRPAAPRPPRSPARSQ